MNLALAPVTDDVGATAYSRALAAVVSAGALLILWGVWNQPPVPDDIAAGYTAVHFMESGQLGPTMWNHPCLRNILIYWSVSLFGANWLGVKASSLLMGIACVPLMAGVARRLTGRRDAALLAAGLWAVEPLAILYSRQAINDIYLAFFPLAGLLCAARWAETSRHRWLVLAGVSFGLGLASKWSVAVPLALASGGAAVALWTRRDAARPDKLATTVLLAAALGALPIAVYATTFLPWFARGYGLRDFGRLQVAMAQETATHQGYLPYLVGDHEPWRWFLAPVSYENYIFPGGFDGSAPPSFETITENATVLLAQGNPLVWLAVLPAVAYVLIRGLRNRRGPLILLGVLFLGSYLPLALASRPIWVNTALTVLPYALMAVAFFACDALARLPGGRWWLGGYLALVLLTAAPLYLLAIGRGMQVEAFRPWMEQYYLHHFSLR